MTLYAATPLDRLGLAGMLCADPAMTLLRETDGAAADVAVICCDGLTEEDVTALRRSATTGRTSAVLLVNRITEADLLLALECRVVDVLPRSAVTPQRLSQSVMAAADSDGVMPAQLVRELLTHIRRVQQEALKSDQADHGLSPREIDVLRLLAEGLETHEIAAELCYSQRTVKNVIYGFTRRLHLHNRSHAVAHAVRTGII